MKNEAIRCRVEVRRGPQPSARERTRAKVAALGRYRALVIGAVAVALPHMAQAQVIDWTYTTDYTLPGGLGELGVGSGMYDQASGAGSGSITFSQPFTVSPPAVQIPLVIWLVLHFAPPAYGISGQSMLDLSQGGLELTSAFSMGPAGSATAFIDIAGTSASVIADLSGLDFGSMPAIGDVFELTSTETIVSTGPGTARGVGEIAVAGLGVIATEVNDYVFTLSPTLVLPSPFIIESTSTVNAPVTPSGFTATFEGISSAVPAPGTTLGIGLLGFASLRQRRTA